jgi:hypothetical protein
MILKGFGFVANVYNGILVTPNEWKYPARKVINSGWDPTTYCSTHYCMDLNLVGLKMTQVSRNM